MMSARAPRQYEQISEPELLMFIRCCLNDNVKREIVHFFSQHPTDTITLFDLAQKVECDDILTLRELIELQETGLIEYFTEHHERVWQLTPAAWVYEMVEAIEDYWIQHPQERHIIVHG
jgi:hypothetical protein